jgi:uncharacterized protein YjlB
MRPETHRFDDDGAIPSNPDLPVLVHHDVAEVAAGADLWSRERREARA